LQCGILVKLLPEMKFYPINAPCDDVGGFDFDGEELMFMKMHE
jgi:hypothetical protein